MITALQIAIRDLIAPLLAADETLTATLEQADEIGAAQTPATGKALYEVRTTMEDALEPEDRHVIYVKARETPAAMRMLREAMVEITVGTPADVEGMTMANHALLEQALDRVWNVTEHPTLAADLAEAIEAELEGWTGGGFFVEGWQEAREDTKMVPVYAVKVGVLRE